MSFMNPENFINPPKSHPEIDSNPEAAMRASQETLYTLLECIGGELLLASEPIHYSSKIFPKGTLGKAQPEAIGHILQCETTNGSDTTVNTNYYILATPDGLHIEKNAGLYESIIIGHGGPVCGKERAEKLGRIMSSYKAREESRKLQNELGLSFVSEAEAQGLIDILSGNTEA